jgi:hypothetical protein
MLISTIGQEELEGLASEFKQLAFGTDRAAQDAAIREPLAAADYPVWTCKVRAWGMKDGE